MKVLLDCHARDIAFPLCINAGFIAPCTLTHGSSKRKNRSTRKVRPCRTKIGSGVTYYFFYESPAHPSGYIVTYEIL